MATAGTYRSLLASASGRLLQRAASHQSASSSSISTRLTGCKTELGTHAGLDFPGQVAARVLGGAQQQRVGCSTRAESTVDASTGAAAVLPVEEQQAALLRELTRSARVTTAAHYAWTMVLRPGDISVDATAGNGHDTLQMARGVGPSGRVYAFDVQEAAIASTRQMMEAEEKATGVKYDVRYIQGCHSSMNEHVGANVAAVVAFNLGYLPGGDKAVTTNPSSTVDAVECALEAVRQGGLISILAYTGHQGGQQEYEAVRDLVAALPTAYWVATEHRLLNRPSAPVLLLVWRR